MLFRSTTCGDQFHALVLAAQRLRSRADEPVGRVLSRGTLGYSACSQSLRRLQRVDLLRVDAEKRSRPGDLLSEERQVGKTCVSSCRFQWPPYQEQKNKIKNLRNS